MALFSLFLIAAWTLIVIRLLAGRATLSERTAMTYLVAGALLGAVISPLTQKLFAPYNDQGPWVAFWVCLARQSILLLPLLRVLRVRALSVADGFLAGFVLGFGFDLSTAVLAAAVAAAPFKNLTLFPPWQFAGPDFTVAGYGYWTALVALAFAASQRFLRQPKPIWITTGVVFLFVVAETATLLVPPQGLLAIFATATFHGRLTAWLALLALVALAIYEAQWTDRAAPATQPQGSRLLTEWQSLLERLLRLKFKDYARLSEQYALQRQTELANAELRAVGRDRTLFQLTQRLQDRLRELKESLTMPSPPVTSPPRPFGFWRNPRVVVWTAWLLLLFVVAVIPQLPTGISRFLWSFWLFHYRPPAFPFTILNAVLVVILIRRYLLGATGSSAPTTPDNAIALYGEKLALDTALAAIILVWIHGRPELFYPFPSTAARFSGTGLPNFSPLQVSTFLLLLATAATGSAAFRMQRWWETPLRERRRAVLRNGLRAGGALLAVWISNAVYAPLVALTHQVLGPTLFNWFGRGGNYYAAILSVVGMVAVGIALYAALQPVSRRIERFLAG